MADTQAESPDSRTSVVGRKRDLHDSMQYRESVDAGDSSDEERSHKRVKETHLPSDTTSPELHLALNDSHSLEQQPSEVEAKESSRLEREKPESALSRKEMDKEDAATTRSIPGIVEHGSDGSQSAAGVQNAIPATWNQGVQSGVRTSFAGKSKRRSRQVNPIRLMGERPESSLDSAIPSATEEDTPMLRDEDTARASDDKIDELVDDGKALISNQTQTETLSSQASFPYQEPQARISESRRHLEGQAWESTNTIETQADLQPEPDSSEGDDSEGEESGHNDIAGSGGPPAISSISEPPAKFQRIGKKKLRYLTAAERQVYDEALAVHMAKRAKNREVKAREVLEEMKDHQPRRSKRKLSRAELELLDPQQQEEYRVLEAKKLEQQRETFEEATRKAAPDDIARGLTCYPRKCSPSYQKSGVYFPLSEILDQGKHIHIEQFSFNVFAPAFLAAHRKRRDLLTQKNVIAAFHLYVSVFYSHVMQFGFTGRLSTTATAGDALTLEQAKRLADMEASNTSNGPLAASSVGQGTVSVPLLAEAIETPDKAKVAGLEPNPSKRGDTKASLRKSDHSGVESSKKENTDLGGTATNVERPMTDKRQTTPKDDDITMVDVVASESTDLTDASVCAKGVESMKFDMDEAELILQQKYFPSRTASTTPRCLSCGCLGHRSSTCPALSCTSCSTFGKHSTASCPFNARCGKCRERGHFKEDCPEKLARSKGEAVACDMCGSKDHLEIACQYIWRSYEPKPEEIRTVRDIPVHCYVCGGSDHYGPECGLHRGRILSGGNSWSKRNLEKYVDPASSDRALSSGIDYSIPPRSNKQFSIKGKANDPIEIDDSDDGEGFIRAKINPPVQSGHIRFGRSNEQSLPRRPHEAAQGSGSMHNYPGGMTYHAAQPLQPPQPPQPPQHGLNRPSGPPQGMHPRSMQGPNIGGGRKMGGPNAQKGGPAEPGKKKRNPRITKRDRDRLQMEANARKRG
jgi:hypothetical protein